LEKSDVGSVSAWSFSWCSKDCAQASTKTQPLNRAPSYRRPSPPNKAKLSGHAGTKTPKSNFYAKFRQKKAAKMAAFLIGYKVSIKL